MPQNPTDSVQYEIIKTIQKKGRQPHVVIGINYSNLSRRSPEYTNAVLVLTLGDEHIHSVRGSAGSSQDAM